MIRRGPFNFVCKICDRYLAPSCFMLYYHAGNGKQYYRVNCRRCEVHIKMCRNRGISRADAKVSAAKHEWLASDKSDGVRRPANECIVCGRKTIDINRNKCLDCRRTLNHANNTSHRVPEAERADFYKGVYAACRRGDWYVPLHRRGETAIGRLCALCKRDLPIESFKVRTDVCAPGTMPRRNDYRRNCKQCERHLGLCRHRGIDRATGRALAAAHDWQLPKQVRVKVCVLCGEPVAKGSPTCANCRLQARTGRTQ